MGTAKKPDEPAPGEPAAANRGAPGATGRPPRDVRTRPSRTGFLPLLTVLVTSAALLLLALALAGLLPGGGGEAADDAAGALVFAHIADPRVAAGPPTSPGNAAVLGDALETLRARPGLPAPQLILLSGELIATPAGAARTGAPPATPDTAPAPQDAVPQQQDTAAAPTDTTVAAYAALGAVLAASPTAVIYLSAGDTIPGEALAAARAAAGGAVSVFDLAACWNAPGVASDPCDLGTKHRLIFLPALPADTLAALRRIEAADSLVTRAQRAGRRVILVPATRPATDSAFRRVADEWNALTGRDAVAAVVAHGSGGSRAPTAWTVDAPPLGAPGDGPSSALRGFALVTLQGSTPQTETLLYDEAFRRIPRYGAPDAGRQGWFARLWERGASLGEPGRSAIFWIAVLTAFLTVAALWKVPEPQPRAAAGAGGASTQTGGQAGAGDAAAPAAAADEGGVFKTNLGRTVLSGLTGIAAVTVLKDLWGISGTTGQAWFVIIFIMAFLVFLVLHATARGSLEAVRDAVAMRGVSGTADDGRSRVSVTLLVFFDTALTVLLGRAPTQLKLWHDRYDELQEALAASVERVREEISDALGDALRKAGFPDALAERDYRVNISVLTKDEPGVLYIASARRSLARPFGERSVAYIAVASSRALWWKTTYQGGRKHIRSAARLRLAGGGIPVRGTPLAAVVLLDEAGASKPLSGRALDAEGRRGDQAPVKIRRPDVVTVGSLLDALNGPQAFGGGVRPAHAWLDAEGYVIIADTAGGECPLEMTKLSLGGEELGPFAPVGTKEVILLRGAAAGFAGSPAGGDLRLDDYFEDRGTMDYAAFIIIPVPFLPRGLTSGDRRGGIHISFTRPGYLEALWSGVDRVVAPDAIAPNYEAHARVLDAPMLTDERLEVALDGAVRFVAEVIHPLNENWLRNRRRR